MISKRHGKGVSHQSRNVGIFTFCIPWWLWFSPSRTHTFLSQAVAVLLSARAVLRGWDTPHRAEKLLNMASEIAGCGRSQGKKLTNVHMVLWGIPRWLRRSYVRNSWITEKGGALCWGWFGIVQGQQYWVTLSAYNPYKAEITLKWYQQYQNSNSTFNIYRSWKWKRGFIER